MFNASKSFLEQTSRETGFIRDNLEKVFRLIDVLEFIYGNDYLRERLVLKGGTAINLTLFDLPRLSVDIDLDYNQNCSRDEMMIARTEVERVLTRYMTASGYYMEKGRGRDTHALNSWVFSYINAGGNRDNIKIEINYSMRAHIFPSVMSSFQHEFMERPVSVMTLASQELFGSKIKALLERTASRDLFDISNMVKRNTLKRAESDLLRKCVLFYKTVGSTGQVKKEFNIENIDKLSFMDFKQTLLPVLRRGELVNVDEMKDKVKTYLSELLTITEMENEYIDLFLNGQYKPDLLFEDRETVKRIENHPMAKWKVHHIREGRQAR